MDAPNSLDLTDLHVLPEAERERLELLDAAVAALVAHADTLAAAECAQVQERRAA